MGGLLTFVSSPEAVTRSASWRVFQRHAESSSSTAVTSTTCYVNLEKHRRKQGHYHRNVTNNYLRKLFSERSPNHLLNNTNLTRALPIRIALTSSLGVAGIFPRPFPVAVAIPTVRGVEVPVTALVAMDSLKSRSAGTSACSEVTLRVHRTPGRTLAKLQRVHWRIWNI